VVPSEFRPTAHHSILFGCTACLDPAKHHAFENYHSHRTSHRAWLVGFQRYCHELCLEQQKVPQPFVVNLVPTPDVAGRLPPALADAILPFLNKFPDACICLSFTFALMHFAGSWLIQSAFAEATASKRAKPSECGTIILCSLRCCRRRLAWLASVCVFVSSVGCRPSTGRDALPYESLSAS
jgi:hypothetical protein